MGAQRQLLGRGPTAVLKHIISCFCFFFKELLLSTISIQLSLACNVFGNLPRKAQKCSFQTVIYEASMEVMNASCSHKKEPHPSQRHACLFHRSRPGIVPI